MVPAIKSSLRRGFYFMSTPSTVCYYWCCMISLRTRIFLLTFATLAAVHGVATATALYWHFWWFDMPMHFFGGSIVALGLFTLADLSFPLPRWLFRTVPFLFVVLLIALVWEFFELWAGIPVEPDYLLDTGIDLTLGLAGGLLGYRLGRLLGEL